MTAFARAARYATRMLLLLGALALAAPVGSAAMVGASLLFTLSLLGVLEHLFLALPFRDGMLWGWALPKRAAAQISEN